MKLLSREEVQRLDKKVVQSGQPQAALIEAVGSKLSQWLHPKISTHDRVLVLMGPGHNGDDAAVVYRRLKNHIPSLHGLKISKTPSAFLHPEEQLFDLGQQSLLPWQDYDWIIDGLFGTGLDRPLDPACQSLLQRANQSPATRVAIDLPTGVDANTGETHGTVFHADHTLTIATAKRGLYLLPARDLCGEIHVIEVASLNQTLGEVLVTTHALPHFDFSGLKPQRQHHKYSRGQVVVALSRDFPGAALLAAQSAQRSGAGYIRVYCPQDFLQSLQIHHPDLVFTAYKDFEHLNACLHEDSYQSAILGCGWREPPPSLQLPTAPEKSFVLDGGFLTSELMHQTYKNAERCVLTPHHGELKRILGDTHLTRWEQVEKFARQWPGVILCKGYDTVIAQGQDRRWITTWNSSSLSTAGSGDILSGLIASFMAQGFPPQQAACLAVDAHRRLAAKNPVSIAPQTLLARIEPVLNDPSDWPGNETE